MKNKLLVTSALASGLLISGAALADVKVSGDVEATWRGLSYDKSTLETKGGDGIGIETNIAIKYTGSTDNGLNVTAGSVIEDGTADTEYLTVGTDSFSVTIGQDVGNNLSSTVVPHVGDQDGTLYSDSSTSVLDNGAAAVIYRNQFSDNDEAHSAPHISLDAKAAGGTVTLRYARNNSEARQSDSVIDTGSGSAIEMLYVGSPMEGLKVQIGTQRETDEVDSATTDGGQLNKIGVAYNFGSISVGAQRQNYDSGAASDSDTKATTVAATFAVSDQVTFGIRRTTTDRDGLADDEEMTTLEMGYSLGSLGFSLAYGKIDAIGGNASTNGDGEVVQARLHQKF
jgi:hypothetical protein